MSNYFRTMLVAFFLILLGVFAPVKADDVLPDSPTDKCELEADEFQREQLEILKGIAPMVADGLITPKEYAKLVDSIDRQINASTKACNAHETITKEEMLLFIESLREDPL